MAKVGFNGQWIEIAKVGRATDSRGVDHAFTPDWIQQVIANYTAGNHEAPIVLGHPDSDSAPAYGWTSELRLNGDVLEARFTDTSDEFEAAVRKGEYKKRSASFYLDPPNLRHIGFLGAQPPAIKGLRDIQFADGESFAVEVQSTITFKETEMGLEDKDVEKVTEGVFEKIKNYFKSPEGKPAEGNSAEFSEAKLTELINDAVATAKQEVTAEFTEKLTKLETANTDLQAKIDGQVAGGVKAEIVSFVEAIPAEKGKHFLKRAGVVEFMEALAAADAADGDKVAINFSEGEGDNKTEHKFSRVAWFKQLVNDMPTIVEFGEKFGNIDASKAADPMINSDRVNAMKDAAGVTDGGEK